LCCSILNRDALVKRIKEQHLFETDSFICYIINVFTVSMTDMLAINVCFSDLSELLREACHSFSLQYWIGWSLQSRNWTASWRASRCQSGPQGGLGWAGWRWERRGLSQVVYSPDLPKGRVTRLCVPHSEMKASVIVRH